MVTMLPNEKVEIHLQTASGQVFIGEAYAASIEMHANTSELTDFDGFKQQAVTSTEWSMELQGTGAPLWQTFADQVMEDIRTAKEWRCIYCDAIHLRERRQCSQCGAWRSFLYDM